MSLVCHFCKQELSAREPGLHQYTRGWVKIRMGGGGHGVSLPEREPYFAHEYCIKRRIQGWDKRQASLFDDATLEQWRQPPAEPEPTNASFDAAGILQHVCNVCGADAPYGIGVALQKGELGLWYCRAHVPPPTDGPEE